MASAGKHQLLGFMSELIPTIRVALCDRFVTTFIGLATCQPVRRFLDTWKDETFSTLFFQQCA